jgi:hypothetical protein
MHTLLDSITTYATAAVVLSLTLVVTNAPAIMTIGGVILLGLRLYVDGSRAYRVWKGHE